MTFGLPGPYFVGGVVLAFALSIGAAIWEKHEAGVAHGAQAVAERQADLSTQDAARWQKAAADRDIVIAALSDRLNDQSTQVEQGRAREADLRASLDVARARNEALRMQADRLSKELDDEASKAPTDVAPLGPIVLRRAPGLFE